MNSIYITSRPDLINSHSQMIDQGPEGLLDSGSGHVTYQSEVKEEYIQIHAPIMPLRSSLNLNKEPGVISQPFQKGLCYIRVSN